MSNHRQEELPPIEFSFRTTAIRSKAFRAITSQNELRKWLAPRVAMSHKRISQKENVDIVMKVISMERDECVHYSWRSEDWEPSIPSTILMVTISDMFEVRRQARDDRYGKDEEGLVVELIHHGWFDAKEREEQEEIWRLAVKSLEHLLGKKSPMLWWEKHKSTTAWHQVKLQALKPFLEIFKKQKKKHIFQGLWALCSSLDEYGKWRLNTEKSSFIFSHKDKRLFQVFEREITFFWMEIGGPSDFYLQDMKDRLAVEQDLVIDIDQAETSISLEVLQPELWAAWCVDLIKEIERTKGIKK